MLDKSTAVGERILLTLWVGALWCVGYVVAPVLFANLETAQAGALAGEMFTAVAYLSLFCGAVLLLLQLLREPRLGNWRAWVVAAMLVGIAAGEFGIRQLMAEESGEAFMRLHGIAQLIYLAVSMLGLALVAFGSRPASGWGRAAT
ncbi:hypothetical protein CAI21_05840 [Alkalilimnicola ehrlichii]|uniref:TMEM205-like domain-containing protein n=1 Tax=Alkalilimnicola ehrlichii TaxID=351052 RepID=A0A3E0X107_9GAMM|nr:DUF4149 domain-containing protein [Alkalilimnicola ehrlichii]RFA30563.1 hypothetical protein CAI21_05840 [Alkalilimnicola ehrlichii]RFA38111.1 hypothetical protein CAL65_07205 [Alkalilimnicola ehrlichii]